MILISSASWTTGLGLDFLDPAMSRLQRAWTTSSVVIIEVIIFMIF